MNAISFRAIIVKAGQQVDIMRPSTTEQFTIYGATALGSRAYELSGDINQSGVDYTLSALDFEGQVFTYPKKGDRIILTDGTQKALETPKEMKGVGGELYGWKCRTVG